MAQTVINNPVINSPFGEPKQHFRFADDGITNEIVTGRRPSSYFTPIAKSKAKGKGLNSILAQTGLPSASRRTSS